MKKDVQEKLDKIKNYYKDKGLLLVGLNDSQGMNITPTFYKKGLLEYLAYLLTSNELEPKVIDAFSHLINKTEHIDYLLKHNLSLEEIRLSQIYSVIGILEKVMMGIYLPKCIGKIGNISRLNYLPKKNEKEIKITTSLKEANEPILIYSSGVNNIMREVGTDPISIKEDYKYKLITPNYYYSLDQIEDRKTITKVINSIDKNFYNILSINSNTDIYMLGAYIPRIFNSENLKMFKEFILKYNEELTKLCKSYNATFINTQKEEKKLYDIVNFNITHKGYKELATDIVNEIYSKKFVLDKKTNNISYDDFEITNLGSKGMVNSLDKESCTYFKEVMCWQDYYAFRKYLIVKEKDMEAKVFRKVYNKTHK